MKLFAVFVAIILALFAAAANGAVMSPCFCNRMLMPVCGSDGITYTNECVFNCVVAEGRHDPEIEMFLAKYEAC